MSRAVSTACPLSDCTLAVDNAENIRNSNDAALLGLKGGSAAAVASTPRARALLRSVKALSRSVGTSDAACAAAPSPRRERVSGTGRTVTTTSAPTATVGVAPAEVAGAPRVAFRPSSLDCHVFAKPFRPASATHRNDPYSPCLLKSPCTPEDSFYACYCDAVEETASAATPANVALASASTPVRSHPARQSAVTPVLPAETQALLEQLNRTSVTPARAGSPMTTPIKMVGSADQSPATTASMGGGVTATPSASTTPERGVSSVSQSPAPTSSARVVRKVVSCGVDRTSGRPVPRPKE